MKFTREDYEDFKDLIKGLLVITVVALVFTALVGGLVCGVIYCVPKVKYAISDSPTKAVLEKINEKEPWIEFGFDDYSAADMYSVMDVATDNGYKVKIDVYSKPYKYQQWIPTARGAGFFITQSGVRVKKVVVLSYAD